MTVRTPGGPPHASSAQAQGYLRPLVLTPPRWAQLWTGRPRKPGFLASPRKRHLALWPFPHLPPDAAGQAWAQPLLRKDLVQEMVKILHPFCIRLQRKHYFFFLPSRRRKKKKKLRAAICRPSDVFLLDSPGPALLGLPGGPARSLPPARASCMLGLPAEPGRCRREAGGAWHCPALCPPPPTPSLLRPGTRPVPTLRTPGVPSPSGPGLRPRVLLAPRAPGHVLGASAARPTLLPALGGEPGTVPGCLGAQPGQGTFRQGVCGEGCGCGWCQGGEAQMPSGHPHATDLHGLPRLPLLSPTKAQTTRVLESKQSCAEPANKQKPLFIYLVHTLR